MKITVDAGHGGHDSGEVGADKTCPPEKTLNLEVASRLAKLLREDGHEVRETRDPNDDEFVELFDRAELANDFGAELFVSVHFNSFSDHEVTGFETYHLRGSKISPPWAESIQEALAREFENHENRGVKQARFLVLKATDMPAVLVECEFISNKDMHKRVSDSLWLDRCARAIFRGIGDRLNAGITAGGHIIGSVCPTCYRPW